MNAAVRDELVAMAAEGRRVRAELAADGSLFDGYHPAMQAVHDWNAARLITITDTHGWPGCRLVGQEGSRAAWLILQHAIGHPTLQRRGLILLRVAVADGDVSAAEVAMLEDRIAFFEGRPQRYGTQYDRTRAASCRRGRSRTRTGSMSGGRRSGCRRWRRTPPASARPPPATARGRRRTGRSDGGSSRSGRGRSGGGIEQRMV